MRHSRRGRRPGANTRSPPASRSSSRARRCKHGCRCLPSPSRTGPSRSAMNGPATPPRRCSSTRANTGADAASRVGWQRAGPAGRAREPDCDAGSRGRSLQARHRSPALGRSAQTVHRLDRSDADGRHRQDDRRQHCRLGVQRSGKGAPHLRVDRADVRKVALEEPPGQLALDDPKVAAARKTLFGAWEMNWLAYNFAHDVELPGSTGPKVGFLMYPQAEVNGERLDALDPDSFKYEIKAKEIPA